MVRESTNKFPVKLDMTIVGPCENLSADFSGPRRSTRFRYKPLEWWRGEKVRYGRGDPGKISYVPSITEIVRIPQDPIQPVKRRRHHPTPRKSHTAKDTKIHNPSKIPDGEMPTRGEVIDWWTGRTISRSTF